ncbi:MFS transporter, DHA1 family, bicyclomycin/chloramphenicol resistance protein [Octadecabacter temperatus]|uniref:Bicyclomycin resistance protein n=2 Tax=Octadecabacter temperatus TaxID=1458307 RepID=A0A0K0Y5B0_9RHOB|nr:Bicyclomycin resistance protein [Octadecabacter temperatus]SIO06550.1 MFS transporter, DHA1 family, bicyclomycin/chloramphenicol resistance protein [Octadecabacter temperatus]
MTSAPKTRKFAPTKALGQVEFVALMAMLTASIAFSIDAMLPALPDIGAELSPDNLNRAQLILTSFVLGMGIGTFFTGPLADRFGRKTVIVWGAVLYVTATIIAYFTTSLETMLAARLLMGIAAAAPRVAAVAMVRDLYSGREMARIMSFVMLVFSLVPALAPTLGAGIIALANWRVLFLAFAMFMSAMTLWMMLRQPETLAPENRRPLSMANLMAAVVEVFSHPTVRLATFVQTLSLGMLFSMLSSTQQVFDQTYGQGHTFHFWFGGIAVLASTASIVNARFVRRLGMRPIIKAMFIAQILISVGMLAVMMLGLPNRIELLFYALWNVSVFFQAGLTLGNLNALALEPMGHIAGSAASIVTATATVGAVIIAIPIGLSFDGTPLRLAIGILVCAFLAFLLTSMIRRDSD